MYNVTFNDINNISSWTIEQLQEEIEKIRTEKTRLVAEQQYELAARLRDREKQLHLELKTRDMEQLKDSLFDKTQ